MPFSGLKKVNSQKPAPIPVRSSSSNNTTTQASSSSKKQKTDVLSSSSSDGQIEIIGVLHEPNRPNVTVEHDDDDDNGIPISNLWVDKYTPKTLDQMIGNRALFESMISWLQQWPEKGRVMCMKGPPSTGKTSSSILLGNLLSYHVALIDTSTVCNYPTLKSKLDHLLQPNTHKMNHMAHRRMYKHARALVVLDEFDGISFRSVKMKRYLIALMKTSLVPMIWICNDHKKLPLEEIFKMNKTYLIFQRADDNVSRNMLLQRCKMILKTEGLSHLFTTNDKKHTPLLSDDQFIQFVDSFNGDIRNCIHTLQFFCSSQQTIVSYEGRTDKQLVLNTNVKDASFDLTMWDNIKSIFQLQPTDFASPQTYRTCAKYYPLSLTYIQDHVYRTLPRPPRHVSDDKKVIVSRINKNIQQKRPIKQYTTSETHLLSYWNNFSQLADDFSYGQLLHPSLYDYTDPDAPPSDFAIFNEIIIPLSLHYTGGHVVNRIEKPEAFDNNYEKKFKRYHEWDSAKKHKASLEQLPDSDSDDDDDTTLVKKDTEKIVSTAHLVISTYELHMLQKHLLSQSTPIPHPELLSLFFFLFEPHTIAEFFYSQLWKETKWESFVALLVSNLQSLASPDVKPIISPSQPLRIKLYQSYTFTIV